MVWAAYNISAYSLAFSESRQSGLMVLACPAMIYCAANGHFSTQQILEEAKLGAGTLSKVHWKGSEGRCSLLLQPGSFLLLALPLLLVSLSLGALHIHDPHLNQPLHKYASRSVECKSG